MSNNKNARLQLIDRIVLLVSSGVESNFQITIDTVEILYELIYRENTRGQNSQNNYKGLKFIRVSCITPLRIHLMTIDLNLILPILSTSDRRH